MGCHFAHEGIIFDRIDSFKPKLMKSLKSLLCFFFFFFNYLVGKHLERPHHHVLTRQKCIKFHFDKTFFLALIWVLFWYFSNIMAIGSSPINVVSSKPQFIKDVFEVRNNIGEKST